MCSTWIKGDVPQHLLGNFVDILLVTVLTPPRCAASTFSLSRPIGSTRPRRDSRVIAKSLRTGNSIQREISVTDTSRRKKIPRL
jgi:hypothetical protein